MTKMVPSPTLATVFDTLLLVQLTPLLTVLPINNI